MKNRKYNYPIITSLVALIILMTVSCSRDDDFLEEAGFSTNGEVFLEGFSGAMAYQAFGDSKLTAFEVVSDVSYKGIAGLRFDIPNEGDPEGSYAGGILTDLGGRNLTRYNALKFWIKGSQAATIGTIGFGTDFIDNQYVTSLNNIDISTTWTQYIMPIPNPSKLTREKGLLLFSDGPDDGKGYTVWIDEVQFEKIESIEQSSAKILNGEDITEQSFIGVSRTIGGLTYTANLPSGLEQTVIAAPSYYNFNSSDTTVAKVNELGVVSILSTGTAVITASIGVMDATGSLTIESIGEFTSAPVPTREAADVISLFSDAYTSVPVDFFNGYYAPFQTTLGQDDINVAGDHIIRYTELNFVGSEFRNPTVNATQMTHLHIDVQIENDLNPEDFIKIELADVGPDELFDGVDDSGGSVTITSDALVSGEWIGLDIPLADFSGLASTSNLGQLIFVTEGTNPGAPGTITDLLVDNIYFYKEGPGGGGGDCTPETGQSLAATDFNLSFQADPGASVGSFDAVLTTVDNPDSDNAVNSSCKVGQIARSGSALFANNQIDFDAKFDFNGNAGFKMKVWSPTAGTNVLVKLEDQANSSVNVEVGATTTMAGAWEELTFDFGSEESDKYDKIILFFELNTNTTETYYIDDFALYGNGGGGATCTPETGQSLAATDFNLSFQADPGASVGSFDAVLTTVANPDFDNAVNSSCQVGQIDRSGSALFANNQIDFDAKFDFNANAGFKMKVWSPSAGTNVLVKLEDQANGGINVEVGATTTMAGAWEELTFDFGSGESDKYDKIILFFELNTNTTETYYIDDFALYGNGGGGAMCTPETGQSLAATDFNLSFQADPGASVGSFDAVLTTVANPDFDNAVNSSCQVGQIDRSGSALFANNQIDFDAKFDFNANAGFKMKVWSPTAGTNVLVKLEDQANGGINVEVGATTTMAGAWEELTFDFGSGESDKYDKIILFFELNTNTTETYYIDDFALYGNGGGGATCTPETGQSLAATDFNLSFQADPGASVGSFDAVLTTVANPDFDNAVNSSCQVGQIARSGSALFANNQIDFDAKFDFNANAGFKMKVWSPTAGTNVLVKLEDQANGGINVEVGATTTMAGAWEELTFDFGSGESDKYDKIILFFELNTNTTETYYIDDFALYGNGGGGAMCTPETGQSLAATDFNLSFQADPGASVGSFDAVLTTVANPDFDNAVNSSCQVGQIARSGSALFANNQIDFDAKFDFNANAGFKMKVWSPTAGTNVLVKLEDQANGGINVEVGATTTMAGAWEELTFNFGSGESDKYDKIILFFELNTNTTETYYIDDFALYSSGGGSGGTGSNFIANGDFETGDDTGWLFFDNGGATAVSNAESNGGSFSAKITSGPTNNPGIKQERFGVGTILPNQLIEVKLDSKVEALLDGAIVNVLAFTESATAGAVLHNLGSVNTAAGSWNANTFTFTTAADASGGVSLLVEVVCGGAATCSGVVFFDNVSVTIK